MLSDEELKAIERRLEHATKGPWVILEPDAPEDFDGPYPKWRGVEADRPDAVIVPKCGGEGYTDSILNADFIAHARTDIPRLLEALREARNAHEKCGAEWAEGVTGMAKQRNEAHRSLEELLDYVDHSPRCRYVLSQQLPFGGFEGCECGLKEAVSRAVKLVGAPEPKDA